MIRKNYENQKDEGNRMSSILRTIGILLGTIGATEIYLFIRTVWIGHKKISLLIVGIVAIVLAIAAILGALIIVLD